MHPSAYLEAQSPLAPRRGKPDSQLPATPRLIFLLVGSDGALDVKQSIMQYVFLADSVPRELADKIVSTISYAPGITHARLYSDEFRLTHTRRYSPSADVLHLLSVYITSLSAHG